MSRIVDIVTAASPTDNLSKFSRAECRKLISSMGGANIQDLLPSDSQPTQENFEQIVRDILETFGLRNAVYYCPTFRQRGKDDPYLFTTYEKAWVDHYIRSNYAAVDPVVNIGVRSLLPLDWSSFDRSHRKVVRMFNESREAGVGSQGLTIPIRGAENGTWGLFTVTSDASDKEWTARRREMLADLVLAANFLHQKACELHAYGEHINLNAITRRETEALGWTAEGKSIADIAILMRISAETVKAHLDSARYKLGALNRVHAVAKAIRHGIIG